MTRGFVLISIGRQGGVEARERLIALLAEGPRSLRPWAALGLGIQAGGDDDERSRAVLRQALADEKSQDAVGAFHLALGLARDLDAEGTLITALAESGTPQSRAVAATSLAMLGTPEGGAALRARFELETDPLARAEIAQAMGFVGEHSDVPALAAALSSSTTYDLRISAAAALGLHGTREGLEALVELASDEDASAVVRASALGAAQVVLGPQPSLTIPELLRQANFSIFPRTLVRLINVPL